VDGGDDVDGELEPVCRPQRVGLLQESGRFADERDPRQRGWPIVDLDRPILWLDTAREGAVEHGVEQVVRLGRLDRVNRLVRELAEHVDVLARPDPGPPWIGTDEHVGQPAVHEQLGELQCCAHLEVGGDGDLASGAETDVALRGAELLGEVLDVGHEGPRPGGGQAAPAAATKIPDYQSILQQSYPVVTVRWQNERRLTMENKAMTLRLPAEQAEALEKVAEVDGVSVTEAIREAIEQHISSRAADKEFRARLAASMERHQRILDRLSKA